MTNLAIDELIELVNDSIKDHSLADAFRVTSRLGSHLSGLHRELRRQMLGSEPQAFLAISQEIYGVDQPKPPVAEVTEQTSLLPAVDRNQDTGISAWVREQCAKLAGWEHVQTSGEVPDVFPELKPRLTRLGDLDSSLMSGVRAAQRMSLPNGLLEALRTLSAGPSYYKHRSIRAEAIRYSVGDLRNWALSYMRAKP